MARIGIFVDKITRSIEEVGSGRSWETDVLRVADLRAVSKRNGWLFNWRTELASSDRAVYKLVIRGDKVIQGLISLRPDNKFIEMELIEKAPHNRGRSKKYEGVAANLVAFACKTSYENGFEGYVAFKAKTKLMQHYIDKLGAELIYRDRMSISGESAKFLVNSYYKNFFNGG